MNLMNEIRRLTDPHQRRARVNIFHPSINLVVGSKCEIQELVLDLELDAEWFQVDALDVDHVGQGTDVGG